MRMPRRFTILLFALLFAVPAFAQRRHAAPIPPPYVADVPPPDVFSGANPTEVITTHVDLDLTVDFDHNQVRGTAAETIRNLTGGTKFVVDTRDMAINSVTIDGAATTWSRPLDTTMGQPLTIVIRPDTHVVRIDYASTTDPKSNALNWLLPPATDGDVAPFLYTFGEPTRTRDWIPIQDTPQVRVTYDAHIRVPKGLLAVMSCGNNPQTASADGNYSFSMKQPIPPYLIALAVGRMQFHALSDRTGFYAEPENVAGATEDLQYVPAMLDAAERLLGPYPFDRYDIVLMPPAFHAGGMENPNANFINVLSASPGNHDVPPEPSTTVSHELSHAWVGDLVTCATWSDTWLNEGFATYYQARILDEMNAPGRAELDFYFDRGSYQSYVAAVSRFPELTKMHREFKVDDRPSTFNTASYQKGAIFLKMLEDSIGRPAFDAFMHDWLTRYRFHWADDRAFIELLGEHVPSLDALHVDEWIYGTGFPANITAPTTAALWTWASDKAAAYASGQSIESLGIASWTPTERNLFLWQTSSAITTHMAEFDAAYHFSTSRTASSYWWIAVSTTLYAPALPAFDRFLMRGGGNVLGAYQELVKTTAGFQYALNIYKKARPQYDWGTQSNVDLILHFSPFSLRNAA